MKKYWVYDLETLNIFTATFMDRDSDEIRKFLISDYKDEREELFNFLKNEVYGLIGYNCINFDSQILEFLIKYPNSSALEIRKYANQIISKIDKKLDFPEWKLKIPHLDLYKIHHFDNKNKRTSLKWCEFSMNLENIEDMPSQGEGNNWEEMVFSYNLNDVIATKELYKRTIPMIQLRKNLSSLYNIKLLNYSNTKIGSEILLKLYCDKTDKDIQEVRSLRTFRKEIIIKDLIFDYIKFNSVEFNLLLKRFQDLVLTNTKKEEEISVIYKRFEFVYGKGGIHGSINNGLVESDENYLIVDADVASLYPSIAIVNNLYPKHLGKEFTQVYKEDIVDVRLAEKAKKDKGNKYIVEGFKEAANASYGNSNSMYSWLYDPNYTMATTINGQLMLTMLAEDLMEIDDLQLIQINTDGLTVKIHKSQLDKYYEVCNKWMQLTKLQLEYVEYSKMIIWDVNNYFSFYKDSDKYKAKGKCEFENIPLHKNKSHSIIPLAIYKYFKYNIPVEQTIKNHTNIFDFCAGVRAKKSDKKGNSHFELHSLKNNKLHKEKLSKTVRYFISNKGSTLIKVYETKDWEQVEAPIKKGVKTLKHWKVTYFNKAYFPEKFKDYGVDYNYYIFKAKEIINQIEIKEQLKLF